MDRFYFNRLSLSAEFHHFSKREQLKFLIYLYCVENRVDTDNYKRQIVDYLKKYGYDETEIISMLNEMFANKEIIIKNEGHYILFPKIIYPVFPLKKSNWRKRLYKDTLFGGKVTMYRLVFFDAMQVYTYYAININDVETFKECIIKEHNKLHAETNIKRVNEYYFPYNLPFGTNYYSIYSEYIHTVDDNQCKLVFPKEMETGLLVYGENAIFEPNTYFHDLFIDESKLIVDTTNIPENINDRLSFLGFLLIEKDLGKKEK